MMRRQGATIVRRLTVLVAASVSPAVAGCATYALPAGATDQASVLRADWLLFVIAGLCVAAILVALIILPLIVWRRRDERFPPQFNRNNPLEITYTVIPLLLVIALFGFTYRNERAVERLSPNPAVTLDVTAFRWSWRFRYGGLAQPFDIVGTPQSPPRVLLPVGETTRIDLESADVVHSFWVPGFLFKRDAIPGMRNQFDVRPLRTGDYLGECAEFCGLDHALMNFTVSVVSRAQFERWLASKQAAARRPHNAAR